MLRNKTGASAVIFLIACLLSTECFSQLPSFFRRFQTGLTMSGFYNPTGEHVYILQQNASVLPKTENHWGATLSLVVTLPFDTVSKRLALLFASPIVDIKDNEAKLLNSQTPFGIGLSWFPLNQMQYFGVAAMVNFGRQKRMRDEAIASRFFPISDYRNLNVGAPVPEAILDPYLKNESLVVYNLGIIFRFD